MANAFWQAVLRFDADKIASDIAVRNTIGIVIPLIAGAILGNPGAGAVAALGALNVCYSDSQDAYVVRARRMFLASVLVGVAAATGALAARNEITSTIAAMLWALGAGMLVVLGQKAGDLGAVTLVTLLVFGAKRLSVQQTLVSGLLAFGGGLLQTLLSIFTWPVNPWDPERRIIADLYRALAQAAVSQTGATGAPPATAAVVNARESLSSLSSNPSEEAGRLTLLLNQAERIRLSLLTVRRLARRLGREPRGRPAARALEQLLAAASVSLKAISECAATGRPFGSLTEFNKTVRDFHEGRWDTPSPMADALLRDTMRQVDALAGQMRAVARLTSPAADAPTPVLVSAAKPDPSERRTRFFANLSFRSSAFRHAVRLAVCVGLGVTIGSILHLERAYWLPMTIAIVLKPDFVGTFSRGILRIAGTMAGLLVATVAVHLLPGGPVTNIVLLAVFSFLLRWIGPANYGIFVIAVSGIVVLLIALTGVNPNDAIVPRAINTVLAGLVALTAYAVWPTWERTQTATVLAEMLDIYRAYFQAVMSGPSTEAAQAELQRVGNEGRIARSNAEASVSRLAAEPGTSVEQRTLANEILISTNIFVRAVMALESDYDGASSATVKAAVREFTQAGTEALELLAAALRSGRKPAGRRPEIRAAWTALERLGSPYSLLMVETDRIATALNTLWEQVAKWNMSHK